MITSNKLNTGFLALQIWFLDYFSVSRSSAPELESFCRSLPHQIDSTLASQGGEKRKRRWREGWGGGGGAIIRERRLFYIFPAKGGRLSELGD